MKLTDDIVRAIQKSIENSFESVSDFARFANVSANTVTRYLNKETESIKEDTWKKLYPLIKNFLPRKSSSHHKPLELTTDEKILVDAFKDLPADVQRQKLMEILDLARKVNKKKAKTQEEEKEAK